MTMTKTKPLGARLAGDSGARRSALDFYQTPVEDVEKFLQKSGLVPNTGTVLEPSAGLGNISTTVSRLRPGASVVSGDIEQREFPLHYVNDFLQQPFKKEVSCVITNPPFSHALEFIERGLEICNGDVIMLLKLAFLETHKRRPLFDKGRLREVWVSSSRIDCYSPDVVVNANGKRTNSSTMALAWFVFNRNYRGYPVIKWL